MRKIKRTCGICVLLILAVFLMTDKSVAAKTKKGKCGAKAKWTYDSKKKTVRVTGKGSVTKPIRVKSEVKKVVIKEGITNLKKLELDIPQTGKIQWKLPNSLTNIQWIGSYQQSSCVGFCISSGVLKLPKKVKKINPVVFKNINPSKIIVDSGNQWYMSQKGILYTKKQDQLLYYPDCKKQKKYRLPASVKQIAPLAFYGNQFLEKVILPKKLKKIGSGAFCECISLSSINLQQTKIKKLTDYEDFCSTKYKPSNPGWAEGELPVWTDGADSVLDSKDFPSLKTTREAEEYFGTFEGTNLTNVKLPESLVYASSDTFAMREVSTDDEEIEVRKPITIYLGKNFTGEINRDTKGYQGKKSLSLSTVPVASITVHSSNKKYRVKNQALYSKDGTVLYQHFMNDKRKMYVIDAETKQIAPGAFSQGDSIVDVVVEGSLDFIGYCAFSDFAAYPDCKFYGDTKRALNSVTVKGNIDRIDARAFCNSNITKFECSGELRYIDQRAFAYCFSLNSITLNHGLQKIAGWAFDYCEKLQPVFAETLTNIGPSAFHGCHGIKTLYFPASVQSIGNSAFNFCNQLETVRFSGEIFHMGKNVFGSCPALKNISKNFTS